jgi:uncharacterized protein with HEPN domain
MQPRDDHASVRQMLCHAREARGFLEGKTREHLNRDRLLVLGLIQLLQIIGEAAGRVSAESAPEVPWPEIVALRNRLIHGYDTIDLDIVWTIVSADLPKLIVDLERIAAS